MTMADPVETTPEMPSADAAHVTAQAGTEVPHEGAEGGLPQFEFQWWGGQIIWLLIIFAVLYVLIGKVFTPRLRKALDARVETIATAVAEARQVQAEADDQAATGARELAEARAQALKIARDAQTKAQEANAAQSAAEDAKLAEKLSVAEAEIRSARDKALGSVKTIAEDTTKALILHLTDKEPSDAEVRTAIAQAQA
jgi:F-type H+-transporting ATPase subunit b